MSKLELCPISSENLIEFCSLGQQPIFYGTTIQSTENDTFHEMIWGSTASGIVHLVSRVSLEELYAKSHNSGLIGKVWQNHHKELACFISTYQPQNICEIGGGHGILCSAYASISSFQSWEIFEPNATSSADKRVTIRNELFDANTKVNKSDCIIHSHLFEHIYDHSAILKAIHNMLFDDGIMIFSVPNMKKMVENGYINALNFEHVTYLPEDLVEYLLERHGFKVVEKKYFLAAHSIFYCCKKVMPKDQLTYYNPSNIDTVTTFFEQNQKDIQDLNKRISKYDRSHQIYLFGAHIFSQFYINNGLKVENIRGVLDNDKAKENKRLYGTPYTVNIPEIIKNVEFPVVILKVGAYRDEIVSQLKNINSAVEIIE